MCVVIFVCPELVVRLFACFIYLFIYLFIKIVYIPSVFYSTGL